jgi:hypothetical protein
MAGLSDHVRIRVALQTAPFAASQTYTDVSDQVLAVTYRHERSGGYGGAIMPAELEIVVENDDGRWNNSSTYASSPYAGNVVPDRLVEFSVRSAAVDSFTVLAVMFIDDIEDAVDTFRGETTIRCSDTFRLLEQYALEDWVRPAETPGARMAALWTEAGMPAWITAVTPDDGNVWLGEATLSGSALAVAQDIAKSELGWLYVDRIGQLRFLDRYTVWLGTYEASVFTFTGDDNDVEFERVVLGQSSHRTPWVMSGAGQSGTLKVYESANRPTNFPATAEEYTGLMCEFDGDVEMNVEGVQKQKETDPVNQAVPAATVSWVASLEGGGIENVRDEISAPSVVVGEWGTLVWRPAGWSSDLTFEGRVEVIEHVIDSRAGTWYSRVTWGPAETRWQADSANFYTIGDTLASTDRGAL